MKALKKIIIAIIILTILLAIVLLVVLKANSKNDDGFIQSGDAGLNIDYNNQEVTKVTDKTRFYTIVNCVNIYLDAINMNNTRYYGRNENNENVLIFSQEEINSNICDLLSSKYMEQKEINISNVKDHIYTLEQDVLFVPVKMNVLLAENIEKYVVYGFITDTQNNFIKEIYMFINFDVSNKTFSVEPIENSDYDNIDSIEVLNDNMRIEKNDNNIVVDAKVNYEFICKEYIQAYKKMALSYPELAYEYLNKEYREKRFGDFEAFKNYIENNKQEIQTLTLAKYQANEKNGYEEYVCIDTNGRYYIFDETEPMEYKMILDLHTIDLQEFTEKYNQGNNQTKVGMNIEKFFDAINTEDYIYAYNVLADSFKTNYYNTEEEFENYINNNLFDNNYTTYDQYTEEGSTYLYEITVKDKTNETSTKKMTIVMQLKEKTDFVMSFSIE